MRLYRKMSNVGFLKKSYAFKFLFIAFIGIHIPLIGILFFVLYAENMIAPDVILIFSLVMTLVATAATLLVLKKLIKPIEMASHALDEYRSSRKVPLLPREFSDEAGMLMRNIQESINKHEDYIQEKQDLMYLLSHDLKTYAGNTQSLAQLLLAEEVSAACREYADLILHSSNQQANLIENFIRLIKEQDEISKNGIHEPQLIQLDKVIAEVENNVAQQLKIKGIRLITAIAVDEVKLWINEDLLLRVLVNLTDNAIKFSYEGSEIKIAVYKEQSKLYLTVSDNGTGFDPAYETEIFKKFTNKGKPGTANEPSTGIGLYLSRKIIEKSGGQLLAESRGVNRGAVFSIVFGT
jgi:signal transduction histidine kinase